MPVSQNRIAELEGKFESEEQRKELEEKYFKPFTKQAQYMGNGVYFWADIYSTDTRELLLLGILGIEGIYAEKF